MSTNLCPRQSVGTNDKQSLWDRIKNISAEDYIKTIKLSQVYTG